ncbi:hypothetical protein THAOC_26062, partial [Thalassiosira oceanica]
MSKSTKGAAAAVPSTITRVRAHGGTGEGGPRVHYGRGARGKDARGRARHGDIGRGLRGDPRAARGGRGRQDGAPVPERPRRQPVLRVRPQDAARDGQRHRRRERLQAEPRDGRGAGGHPRPEGPDGADPPPVRPDDGHEGPRPARDAELWRPAPAEVDFGEMAREFKRFNEE